MKLLHLDSSILGELSVSRQLSSAIVARQRFLHHDLDVVYRDLATDPPLHLSGAHLAAFEGQSVDDTVVIADLHKGNAYLEELIAADIVVIGAPMYNLSIPTSLKGWIDRITVEDKTFRYTATGPEGLLKNKKAFIASARGGLYSPDTSDVAIEHQESYLIAMLSFIGIQDISVVRAEGLALGPEAKELALAKTMEEIRAIVA